MRFSGYFILVFALVLSSARAQDIAVRAVLDTNKALIGDQINLRLIVEKPSGDILVNFPALGDTLTRNIEIINISAVDTIIDSEGSALSQDILVTVFDTGFFEIPALPFRIFSAGRVDTLNTLPISFEIMSVKADSTIRDIKGIYKVPVSLREIAPYNLAAIGIVLLTWLLIHFIRKRRSGKSGQLLAVSSEPPDIIALRALDQLKEEKPWMHNRIKYFYIRISEILRVYIEGRFKTQALEQTTDEILCSLKSTVLVTTDYNKLSAILKLSDLVKFAKVIPDQEDNALQIDAAREFVRSTTVAVVAEPDDNESKLEMVDNKLPS